MQQGLRDFIAAELDHLESGVWPEHLPVASSMPICFRTTCFSWRQVSGLIDFYFACTDMLAYDVAICLNAWCFEPDRSFNVTKARALIDAYERSRG